MSIVWGPNTYIETDSPPAGNPLFPGVLVKSIAIDFSTIPTGVHALSLVFTAGEALWYENGALLIFVGGTSTGADGTLIWAPNPPIDGVGGSWAPLDGGFGLTDGVPLSPFTNPNPVGTSYLKFFSIRGSTAPTDPAGIRNFTIQIEAAGPPPPPPPPTVGDTGKDNFLIVPASDDVWAGGLNRVSQVTAVADATHFSYRTSDQDYRRSYTESRPMPVVTPSKAAAAPAGIPGPFSFDTKKGLAVTAVEQTLAQDLNEDSSYSSFALDTGIDPNPALQFPNAPGYLVFDFGFQDMVGPVRYLGRLSGSELLLSASFRFPNTIKRGSKVTLLTSKSPVEPPAGTLPGSFYVTGSAAGRIAAQNTLDQITAAGLPIDVEILYPGDRGLGGEGLVVRGASKLSDKVAVWGGDELDVEIPNARTGS